MGGDVLAMLGGSLFTPLAVAYALALALAVIVMLRDSESKEGGTDTPRE